MRSWKNFGQSKAEGSWTAILGSFFAGGVAATLAIFLSAHWPGPTLQLESGTPSHQNLTFAASKAEAVLGELTAKEIRSTADWFLNRTQGSGVRNGSADCIWLAGPSGVELLRPPKAAVLSYLAGTGHKPPRFARLTAVGPSGVQEFKAGPLIDGSIDANAVLEPLLKKGDVPYSKRPTEPNSDQRLLEPLTNVTLKALGPLLLRTFGPVFPQLDGYRGSEGSVVIFPQNNALAPRGSRVILMKALWSPAPPGRLEAMWMHPMPLDLHFNTTAMNPASWKLLMIFYCNQGPFSSAEDLMDAWRHGKLRICPFPKPRTGPWDVPQRETPASSHGVSLEEHGGVSWGPWTFTVTQRPSTGPSLVDVKYNGERILYELSMQDAQAAYSGTEETSFFYSDAAWSLSMLGTSLEPGVDCPAGAHFLKASSWYHFLRGGGAESDVTKPFAFRPICIFEFDEDHTIWRHMQNDRAPNVHGLLRKTVVVRSICTVGNYDYLSDIKLREDGEIEVHTRFGGYIESRYYHPDFNPGEVNFSTIIGPNLAGPVHSHLVAWKADIDVAGVQANTLRHTRVTTMPVEGSFSGQKLVSKNLVKTDVEREGVDKSTFVANPKNPGVWAVVDRSATSAAGNPRGYAVTLSSFATLQVLPDNHPFVQAMPFTKYHLAVTRYHDEEYRVNSPYVQYDGQATGKDGQNLDRFLSDEELLLDEDLVAWIGVGREHIVRQEDQPLVSNFGAGFSLQPWNFFERNMAASPPK
mmetsp:Transcript_61826/g.109793  ORF Transcript_61826/g.109793 Transcript_61826/m.109793 type:complete len:750 (-) Transcript_61826:290-2539(-)